MLRRGAKIEIRGTLPAETLWGFDEGSRVRFSSGENYLVFRPTYADLIPHLPRAAQVIYPKDTGPLLIWGDVYPGATVIEGGVGAGALTIALLRAVGPAGRVISYEIREDFAAAARKNVAAFFGEAPAWTLKLRDLYEGFDETEVDRLFLDLPEPGRALEVAARALRPGGVFVAYVPTALQLKETVDALQYSGNFAEIDSFETLMRHWQVKGLSVRPVHRMVAHSAFIIIARRLAASAFVMPLQSNNGVAASVETEAASSEAALTAGDADPIAELTDELVDELDDDLIDPDRRDD